MAIIFKLTAAGRQALINAAQDGTQARRIVSVGVTATAFTPTESIAAIPGEIKRIETVAGDVVAKDTIHVTVRDDGSQAYTVRGLGLYLDNGVLLGTYSQAAVILEKSVASIFLLSTDLRVLDGSVDISTLQFGETNFINPPATTERQGVVELANQEEAMALEDRGRALTPHSVKPLFEGKSDIGHGHSSATPTAAGFMSVEDKKKLDGIAAEANKYAHPTGDGNQHVPVTGTGNNGKVLTAGATAGAMSWQTPLALGTKATDAAKGDHGHDAATPTAAGFMSVEDKKKLDGIAAEANKYAHPTGDGNQHVPVTGTGNNGKVLTAGATAGAMSWQTPLALGTKATDAAKGDHGHNAATPTAAGFMSVEDKKKLDGIAAEANKYAHPTGDGNQHVPVTGTGNNGKVLTAGATAGAMSWKTPLALGTKATDAAKGDHGHNAATPTAAGFMSVEDKKKLDGIEARQKALGDGQTVMDMLSLRAFGVTYTNTTKQTIWVAVNRAGQNHIEAYVNGVAVASCLPNAVGSNTFVGFPVPAGAQYQINSGGGGGLFYWTEIR